ncbi:MAG: ABC-type phosphate transport system, periplasmic component, partial [Clostridia bacterium]|nr:ABC-type phosphate transport system, periplasmic component [Clostridia bacterium]
MAEDPPAEELQSDVPPAVAVPSEDMPAEEIPGEIKPTPYVMSEEEKTLLESGDIKAYLQQYFPKADGSTSTIPLEAAFRSVILGIPVEEAENQVSHATTYGSFYNLMNGECDVIFSTPLSQEQYDYAEYRKNEPELVPIAMEAFVFVVNINNPIDTLTQQQLKDIYSGKITNW